MRLALSFVLIFLPPFLLFILVPREYLLALPAVLWLFLGLTHSKLEIFKRRQTRIASREEYNDLYQIVKALSTKANIKRPKIHIMAEESPNAFTIGMSSPQYSITLTTGLIELLDKEELEAVLSHEIAHIKNNDVLATTLAIKMYPGVFQLLLPLLISPLLQSKELAADELGAMISGQPKLLAKALWKINNSISNTSGITIEELSEMNRFFIIPLPLNISARSYYASHPPIEERISRLMKMEEELN